MYCGVTVMPADLELNERAVNYCSFTGGQMKGMCASGAKIIRLVFVVEQFA